MSHHEEDIFKATTPWRDVTDPLILDHMSIIGTDRHFVIGDNEVPYSIVRGEKDEMGECNHVCAIPYPSEGYIPIKEVASYFDAFSWNEWIMGLSPPSKISEIVVFGTMLVGPMFEEAWHLVVGVKYVGDRKVDIEEHLARKRMALDGLSIDEVDLEFVPYLSRINEISWLYTTGCCAGHGENHKSYDEPRIEDPYLCFRFLGDHKDDVVAALSEWYRRLPEDPDAIFLIDDDSVRVQFGSVESFHEECESLVSLLENRFRESGMIDSIMEKHRDGFRRLSNRQSREVI